MKVFCFIYLFISAPLHNIFIHKRHYSKLRILIQWCFYNGSKSKYQNELQLHKVMTAVAVISLGQGKKCIWSEGACWRSLCLLQCWSLEHIFSCAISAVGCLPVLSWLASFVPCACLSQHFLSSLHLGVSIVADANNWKWNFNLICLVRLAIFLKKYYLILTHNGNDCFRA